MHSINLLTNLKFKCLFLGTISIMLSYKQVLSRLECLISKEGLSNNIRTKPMMKGSKLLKPIVEKESSPSNNRSNESPLNDSRLDSTNTNSDFDLPRVRTETLESISSAKSEEHIELTHQEDPEDQEDDDDEVESIGSDEDLNYYDTRYITRSGEHAPEEYKKLLYPILVALYTRHGTISQLAIQSLDGLFRNTDFFEPDLKIHPTTGCTTLLDLVIESVCDK